jgi:hypothetical protein
VKLTRYVSELESEFESELESEFEPACESTGFLGNRLPEPLLRLCPGDLGFLGFPFDSLFGPELDSFPVAFGSAVFLFCGLELLRFFGPKPKRARMDS